MKKKWLKIVALVVALLIIAGLCVFANALVGNWYVGRIVA